MGSDTIRAIAGEFVRTLLERPERKYMGKLSLQVVNTAEPASKTVLIWDDELKGFHLRVSARGVKTYAVVYRNAAGKQRWLTLGRHGVLTPYEARNLAKQHLGAVAAGEDPAAEKKDKRQSRRNVQENSFKTVVARYLADRQTELRQTTIRTYTIVLNNVPEAWQSKPVSDIARKDVMAFLDTLKAAGKLPMARLNLLVLSAFFGWCLDRELISVLPAMRIKLAPSKARERALSVHELRGVWAACGKLGGVKGDVVKLLMLCGQRRTETAAMRWQDIEGRVWTIPGEVAKNHRTHVVPLASEALAIINRQPHYGDHVFTFNGSMAMASGTFDLIKRELDKVIEGKIAPWHLHDLRRSLVTGLHEHDLADPHTIELIVNHVGGLRGGIAGVYDRSTRMDARRKALEAWARLITGTEIDNVVPFRESLRARA